MRLGVLAPIVILIQTAVFAQSGPLEFDVASIKRAVGDFLSVGSAMPVRPESSGRIVMRLVTARALVLRAYPTGTTPETVEGLPGWADSERYDVEVTTSPGRSRDDLLQMWRTLLADRMKLSAHYDIKELQSYELVLARADGKLGPNLRPSRLDCTQPQAPPKPMPGMDIKQMSLSFCGRAFNAPDSTTYAGGMRLADFIRAAGLMSAVGKPIVDRTGLESYFEISLQYRRGPELPGKSADELPSLFAAVQEQLGLKLQATKTQTQIVVVDHIERPTAN
jgi:uncharacterized protein (TIGR03435 family)